MNLGLVQNGMLFGLLALLIPFLIHLMFRQRPRDVQIGSVRFLQQIMDKSKSRRRVMQWLLMGLRMAGIALLVLLFARPYLISKADDVKGGQFVAILIDRSASMQLQSEGKSSIRSAVESARKLVRNANEKTQFEVAFFDHTVEPINTEGGDDSHKALINQIDVPSDSYSATDYAAAFRWAHDVCTTAKAETKQLHVFTDLQQSGLAWSEVEPMPKDVVVKVHDLGRELPNNVAIIGSTPEHLVVRPGESTSLKVSLLNAGPFGLDDVPVVLQIKNGSRTIQKRKKVKLEPGGIQTAEFEIPDLSLGLWRGTVAVEAIDDLSFDNQRHLAVMATPQYGVLLIDGEENETSLLSESHYLQSALRLAPEGAAYADSPYVPAMDSDGRPLTDFDIVILANVATIGERESERLKSFVDDGGGLVVFSGDQVSVDGYQSLSSRGLLPGEIVAAREAFHLPWRIGEWDKEHSIFSLFNDPQHGDLKRLTFRGITEMKPADDAKVVAKFSDGKPFLMEKQLGTKGGTVVWVATSCDNQWGNWTQSELYLPIMHQIMGHLTGLNSGGHVTEALIDTTAEGLASTSPGVFEKQRSWQVVNVSPRESETDRCTIDDFVSRFDLNTGAEEEQPAVRAGFGGTVDIRQNEIWHWILFALITVVIAEYCISNRTVA